MIGVTPSNQGGHWSVGQISTYEMANYPEDEENMESDSAILMNNKNSQALYLGISGAVVHTV